MKPHVKIKWLLFTFLIGFAYTESIAQMQKNDWIGSYTMNHDGWEGSLVIQDTKRDCSNSPWCSFQVYYIDSKGNKRKAAINSFSKDWQNINFQVFYPQHTQHFNGYLFSHDKTLLAGTTEWNKKNYGFYAKKQPANAINPGKIKDLKVHGQESLKVIGQASEAQNVHPDKDEVVAKKILDDGAVEYTYKSGMVRTYADGVIKVKLADGTEQSYIMMQVMDLVPPMPNEPDVHTWLGKLNSNMDDIVSHLVHGDATSLNNYKKAMSKFQDAERINNSMKMIGFLIE